MENSIVMNISAYLSCRELEICALNNCFSPWKTASPKHNVCIYHRRGWIHAVDTLFYWNWHNHECLYMRRVARLIYSSRSFSCLIFELLQCSGYMGFLCSWCIACNSSGHKTEIFGTPCILWNNWYDARYNYGNQCLCKRTRRTPNETFGRSTKICSRWSLGWWCNRTLMAFRSSGLWLQRLAISLRFTWLVTSIFSFAEKRSNNVLWCGFKTIFS